MGKLKHRGSSAGMPTVRMSADPPAYTLSPERIPLSRRAKALIALNILGLVVAASLVAWAFLRTDPSSTSGTSAPSAVAAQPAPAVLPALDPQTCIAVPGVPVFADAICVKQDTDHEDGVVTQDNTYVVAAGANVVRRFFEQELVQNGWTLTKSSHDVEDGDWSFQAVQGPREVKVAGETRQGPEGAFTQFRISED